MARTYAIDHALLALHAFALKTHLFQALIVHTDYLIVVDDRSYPDSLRIFHGIDFL